MSLQPGRVGGTDAAIERLAARAADNLLADPIVSSDNGQWVHRFSREMSQLQGAFQLTGPTEISLSLAGGWTLIAQGNPSRFALWIWSGDGNIIEMSPIMPPPSGRGFAFVFNTGLNPFAYNQYGAIISAPWYARVPSTGTVALVEIVEAIMV